MIDLVIHDKLKKTFQKLVVSGTIYNVLWSLEVLILVLNSEKGAGVIAQQ